jgi:hypothetical protein
MRAAQITSAGVVQGDTNMREDHDSILGQMDIRLQRIRANLCRSSEGRHGVLRELCLEAAMRDRLREAAGAMSIHEAGREAGKGSAAQ